ncbi:MAG: hypothetical protein II879_04000 [Clostridia bacterium]|nr:hypothetical protein [Clostridia bacterium]
MKTRMTALVLAMVLLTSLLVPMAALADSWICPNCGTENSHNFCSECGAPRPEATPEPAAAPVIPLFPSLVITPVPAARTEQPATAVPTAEPTEIPTPEPTPVPTPVPTPEPTEVPTPEPTAAPESQWIDRFSTANTVGKLSVTFTGFAETHPGQYYIYTCYTVNNYYNWYTMDEGQTSWQVDVIPGEEMLVGVYWDAASTGRPAFDADSMKRIKLMDAAPYKDIGFYEIEHDACVAEGDAILDINTFSVSDVTDEDIGTFAYFKWGFDISKTTKFPVMAVLRSPSGMLYFETSSFEFEPNDSGTYFRYKLDDILNDCYLNDDLTDGEYRFDLYRLGKLVGTVPFSIGPSRQLKTTPTPVPTAVPTPVPTAAPTKIPRSFRIHEPTMSKGFTTISWEDSENRGPYTVYVQHEHSGGLGERQTVVTGSNLKSVTNGYVLVPGEPYTITVCDSYGETATYSYHPAQRTFPDFKVTASMELRVETSKGTRTTDRSFKASEIKNKISEFDYFAYITITYPQIRYERTANWTGAVTIPNGDVFLTSLNENTVIPADSKHNKIYLYWKHYTFNDVFKYLLETSGSIPTGKYIWTLYFDGENAGSTTFNVTN